MESVEVEELVQNCAYHMRVFWVFNGFSGEDGDCDENEEEYEEDENREECDGEKTKDFHLCVIDWDVKIFIE